MRGATHTFGPSRVKGRQSLLRRLRALVVASHRFGTHRACTCEERQFAGRLFDGLKQTLDSIEHDADGER
jgi:hypothetical protein